MVARFRLNAGANGSYGHPCFRWDSRRREDFVDLIEWAAISSLARSEAHFEDFEHPIAVS